MSTHKKFMRRTFAIAGSNIAGFAWLPTACNKETLEKHNHMQNQRQKKSSVNVRGNLFHTVEQKSASRPPQHEQISRVLAESFVGMGLLNAITHAVLCTIYIIQYTMYAIVLAGRRSGRISRGFKPGEPQNRPSGRQPAGRRCRF